MVEEWRNRGSRRFSMLNDSLFQYCSDIHRQKSLVLGQGVMTIQVQNVPSSRPPPYCVRAISEDAEIVRRTVLRQCQLLWVPAQCLLNKKVLPHVLEEQTAPQHQPWGKIQRNVARDVQPLTTLSGGFPPCTEIVQETGWIYYYCSNSQGNLLGTGSAPEEKCLLSSLGLPCWGLMR